VPNGEFLDPVSEDAPKGCWTLRMDMGRGVVELRSLLWPGYFFFAAIGSAKFGGVYVGDGQQNLDLQFMM
jgi:radial spoke head protein 9